MIGFVMEILVISQALVSLILIVLILLQQKGTALGSLFGFGGETFAARRGIEKNIFYLTCFFGALFIALSILNLAF